MRLTPLRGAAAIVGAGALLVPLVAASATAASDPRVRVGGTSPSWATSKNQVGTPSSGAVLTFRVGLRTRHQDDAEAFVRAVSDPDSPQYGHYLTPAQYHARFTPASSSVDSVTDYLTGAGLDVTGVAAGNQWVTVRGTVAQVDKAFDTTLRTYRTDGGTLRAPSDDVSLPSSVADDVSGVAGLTQDSGLRQPDTVKVPDVGSSASANADKPPASECSDYWGEYQQTVPRAYGKTSYNTFICGYTPAQLRKAYSTDSLVAHGTTGKGVTVAIIDAYASPTMESDANAYATAVGDQPFAKGQYSEKVFGPFTEQDECGGEEGWNGEQSLDVEAVHGMAPSANVLYVGAADCETGLDDAVQWVIDTHAAEIVSNSYGFVGEDVPADQIALLHGQFLQAAAEGIGMYFSSGDDGDNTINDLAPQPDYSSSDPLVTGVGGTSLLLDKRGNTVTETGWETTLDLVDYTGDTPVYSSPLPGDYFFGGGGGGVSTLFAQPWYQRGVVPTSLARSRGGEAMRVAPDVSAVGDPYTGFYYGMTVDGEFVIDAIGGTSLSTPLFAGIQALASQGRAVDIGFANPLLYDLPSAAFHDVVPTAPLHFASTLGNYLGTFDQGSTQTVTKGYDDTTGLGTPDGTVLVTAERYTH